MAIRRTLQVNVVWQIGSHFRATVKVPGVIHMFGMFDDPVAAGLAASALRRSLMLASTEAAA